MTGLTYVITGANRGLGKGLLTAIIARPDTTVIAAVRDVVSSTQTLNSIPVGKGSKLIVVKVNSTVDSDPATAVSELKSKGISKVDILISNAGYMGPITGTLETTPATIRDSLEVNTVGPFNLIKAFYPLLEASSEPKFIVLSSVIGSITLLKDIQVPFFAYGLSKAAVNYLVHKLSFDYPKLASHAIHPGWVQTDMGSGAAKHVGMADAPMTLEESIKGLTGLIDASSLEKSGSFTNIEGGAEIPW